MIFPETSSQFGDFPASHVSKMCQDGAFQPYFSWGKPETLRRHDIWINMGNDGFHVVLCDFFFYVFFLCAFSGFMIPIQLTVSLLSDVHQESEKRLPYNPIIPFTDSKRICFKPHRSHATAHTSPSHRMGLNSYRLIWKLSHPLRMIAPKE